MAKASPVFGSEVRDVLSVENAAALLGISRTAAYAAVERGEIPAVRIGARILVPRFRLEHLLRTGHDIPEAQLRVAE